MTEKEFAEVLTKWLHTVPKENLDWAEALVNAALDETQGDLELSLQIAREEYNKDPTGKDEGAE